MYGTGKTVNAIRKNFKANEYNEVAKNLMNESQKCLDYKRQQTDHYLQRLGIKKLEASVVIRDFIEIFNPIYHFKYIDQALESPDYKQCESNLKTFSFAALKADMDNLLSDSLLTGSAGATGSILLTLGAYNGTALLASASTGTAISTLSGVAASNATLAWLGGGTLATGGFGISGGTIVLGTVATAPILLALGIVLDNKASKKLEDAYQYLDKADDFIKDNNINIEKLAEIQLVTAFLRNTVFNKIKEAKQLLIDLKNITEQKGYDFLTYSPEEQVTVCNTVITIQIIKNLFDTAILNEQGELIITTEEITAIKQNSNITI